jgi:hypothetical protein
MATITRLYPLLKEIGLNDQKSQEFIEIIEESYNSKVAQEVKGLVTNETFLTEITKIREEISKIREDLTRETTSIREDLTRETTSIREDLTRETTSIREEMASMKVEIIKWNVGTIIAVAGLVTAIVKLIG